MAESAYPQFVLVNPKGEARGTLTKLTLINASDSEADAGVNGQWFNIEGRLDNTVHLVLGTRNTNAVTVHLSNSLTTPAPTDDGFQYSSDTTNRLYVLPSPISWIKVKIASGAGTGAIQALYSGM